MNRKALIATGVIMILAACFGVGESLFAYDTGREWYIDGLLFCGSCALARWGYQLIVRGQQLP